MINKSHNTEDCYLVKRRKIAAQENNSQHKKKDAILTKFKDLNAFVEAKIQHSPKNKKKFRNTE